MASRAVSLLALSTILTLVTSCGDEGEVLAEFKGGEVTRGELRHAVALRARGEVPSEIPVEQQYSFLRDYAIMKIFAHEAKKEKLSESPAFHQNTLLMEELNALDAYERYVQESVYDREFKMMDMQFVLLRSNRDGERVSRKEEADDLAGKLNQSSLSDEKRDQLVAEKTEIPRYSMTAGYLDPHCISCEPNGLSYMTDPLQKAEQDKFIVVENPEGAWIVRKVRTYSVGADSLKSAFLKHADRVASVMKHLSSGEYATPNIRQRIEKRIPSESDRKSMAEQQASAWVRRHKKQLLQEKQQEIQKETSIEIHDALKQQRRTARGQDPAFKEVELTPSTPLFTLDGKTTTYGDVLKKLGDDRSLHPPKDRILMLVRGVLIPYKILSKKEGFDAALESDYYDFLQNYRKNQLLARVYLDSQELNVEVTREEIQNYYNMKKNTAFKGKSLRKVQGPIEQELQRNKQQEKLKELRDSLAETYELKVYKDRLKPGAI